MKSFSFARLGTLVAAAVFAAGTLAPDAAQAQKKIRWKMHGAYGKNLAVIGPPANRIANWVRDMSGGKFDIKVFEPGALAGGFAYYDPVSKGSFEAAFGTPGANQGKNSAYAFLSSWPFGPGLGEFLAWLEYGGGIKIADELYARDNIKYLMCGLLSPETSGWFRKPIKTTDDLKGLKMRFFGVGAKVMQKFGVSTQQLAAGDIYPALELGTIDATEFSMPAIDRSLGFYQIAKYNYFPGWHQQATTTEVIVNMDKWKGLPKEYQAMLYGACKANIGIQIADGESQQFAAMLANEKDGVKNMTWSDDVLKALRKAWEEVVAEEVKANPDVKKLWDSYTAFHEKYKVWGERGYLK
ncbi:MAG: TRAP transporter substrate-binding protein [Burkholderiaceae bacterium]|nr:TRAP transporter substrate-binding protein [Burkholderiaceae bacterium]